MTATNPKTGTKLIYLVEPYMTEGPLHSYLILSQFSDKNYLIYNVGDLCSFQRSWWFIRSLPDLIEIFRMS